MSVAVEFAVENAGCPSCAARVREALSPLADVNRIDVDEQADTARVRLSAEGEIDERAVVEALAEASEGSGGHAYRVAPGTWSTKN